MGKYIFKRILAMVPVVLLVTFAVFILSYVALRSVHTQLCGCR